MLSKFLITSLVVVIAFFVLRQRKVIQQSSTKATKTPNQLSAPAATKDELSSDLRFAAYAFLALCIGAAVTMYYFQWQEDHKVLTINLYRESQTEPVSYQVYRFQLDEKSFVTIEGVSVSVASSERMEIVGLD